MSWSLMVRAIHHLKLLMMEISGYGLPVKILEVGELDLSYREEFEFMWYKMVKMHYVSANDSFC